VWYTIIYRPISSTAKYGRRSLHRVYDHVPHVESEISAVNVCVEVHQFLNITSRHFFPDYCPRFKDPSFKATFFDKIRLINEPKTYFFRTNIYDSNYCHHIKINKTPAHEVKVFFV
jgi:hypothetical protein